MTMIGARDKKITIQTATESNSGGVISKSWSTYVQSWAAIWPLKSGELIEAGNLEHKISHRIRIDYVSGIKSSMRAVYGSRTFQFRSVINPDEANIEIEIMAEETTS